MKVKAPGNTGTRDGETWGREDAEGLGGKEEKQTAEHGAGSTSVAIMNGQLLFSGTKQRPHSLTSTHLHGQRRSHGEVGSRTEMHSKHTEISEKLQHCSRFCFSPKNSEQPPKFQCNLELYWGGEQKLQKTILLSQKFLTCKWRERVSR